MDLEELSTTVNLRECRAPTIIRGYQELKENEKLSVIEGIRSSVAGQPTVGDKDQTLDAAIQKIMHQTTAGTAVSGQRWT